MRTLPLARVLDNRAGVPTHTRNLPPSLLFANALLTIRALRHLSLNDGDGRHRGQRPGGRSQAAIKGSRRGRQSVMARCRYRRYGEYVQASVRKVPYQADKHATKVSTTTFVLVFAAASAAAIGRSSVNTGTKPRVALNHKW